jgi:DNA-binding cell septation regulator SpoVG
MEGNIKAFFKVQTGEGFVIDGFKIMNGKNGLFARRSERDSLKP